MGIVPARIAAVQAADCDGVRPTVAHHGATQLEVFIFDLADTIYGTRIHVDFLHKLRDEERYPDLDTLRRQIASDVEHVRAYFAAGH